MSLPGVFANKIEKVINNNDDYYHEERSSVIKRDVRELRRYFDRNGYAEKLIVKLYYSDNKSSVERLILCKGDYFINIDNKKIYFSDVSNFEVQ